MRHIDRPAPNTQHLVFNLYGDYLIRWGDAAPTAGLLDVMGVLDVGERAARSTLSRMKQRGWLAARRFGRRSAYDLTPRGRLLLEEGDRRLFGERTAAWDGRWHIITYSLPPQRRQARHHLRTRLMWLGYGSLQPGVVVSAYGRAGEVAGLLADLKVDQDVHVFAGAHLPADRQSQIVARCWDLPTIDRRYAGFLERYAPIARDLRRRRRCVSDVEGFIWRFWATYDYSEFPRLDPFLPTELLPQDWRGEIAHRLIQDLREDLRRPAEAFLQRTLGLEAIPARPASARPLAAAARATEGAAA